KRRYHEYMSLISRRHVPAVLAACAFLGPVLVASVLQARPQTSSAPQSSPADQAQADAPAIAGPRIDVEPPSFDFGKVRPDKALHREFSIRNLGTEDLVVESVSTSCGCTVTDPPPPVKMVVKPGGSEPLRVTLTTPVKPGQISKSMLIKSN